MDELEIEPFSKVDGVGLEPTRSFQTTAYQTVRLTNLHIHPFTSQMSAEWI